MDGWMDGWEQQRKNSRETEIGTCPRRHGVAGRGIAPRGLRCKQWGGASRGGRSGEVFILPVYR